VSLGSQASKCGLKIAHFARNIYRITRTFSVLLVQILLCTVGLTQLCATPYHDPALRLLFLSQCQKKRKLCYRRYRCYFCVLVHCFSPHGRPSWGPRDAPSRYQFPLSFFQISIFPYFWKDFSFSIPMTLSVPKVRYWLTLTITLTLTLTFGIADLQILGWYCIYSLCLAAFGSNSPSLFGLYFAGFWWTCFIWMLHQLLLSGCYTPWHCRSSICRCLLAARHRKLRSPPLIQSHPYQALLHLYHTQTLPEADYIDILILGLF